MDLHIYVKQKPGVWKYVIVMMMHDLKRILINYSIVYIIVSNVSFLFLNLVFNKSFILNSIKDYYHEKMLLLHNIILYG